MADWYIEQPLTEEEIIKQIGKLFVKWEDLLNEQQANQITPVIDRTIGCYIELGNRTWDFTGDKLRFAPLDSNRCRWCGGHYTQTRAMQYE